MQEVRGIPPTRARFRGAPPRRGECSVVCIPVALRCPASAVFARRWRCHRVVVERVAVGQTTQHTGITGVFQLGRPRAHTQPKYRCARRSVYHRHAISDEQNCAINPQRCKVFRKIIAYPSAMAVPSASSDRFKLGDQPMSIDFVEGYPHRRRGICGGVGAHNNGLVHEKQRHRVMPVP